MSETETNSGASPCDQLLEFVYGELDEAQKRAFETHLAGCARCQAEAASFGRSHEAARRVMPMVEPPATMTGALHAQLLHAASQRRPKRGVVLQLFRRVAQHPQMAAAAMFVIVGGAFVFSWRKAKMFPPAMELSAPAVSVAETLKPTEAKTIEGGEGFDKLAANQPANGIQLPAGEKNELAKAEPGNDRVSYKRGEAMKSLEKNKELAPDATTVVDGKIVLATPPAAYNVDRTPAHHAAYGAGGAPAPKAMRAVAKDSLKLRDTSDGLGGLGDTESGNSGGKGGGAGSGVIGGMVARNDSAKSSAPSTRVLQEPRSPGGLAQSAAPPPAPVTTASADKPRPALQPQEEQQNIPNAAPAPVASGSDADDGYAAQRKTAPAKKPSAPPVNTELQRKRFDDLARGNRCDEAIRVFQELERSTQHITPSERAQYVRCLSAAGRQQQAEQQLLELKADKKVSNSEVQKLQDELDGTRTKQRRAEKAKKSVTPAPADDRASQERESPAQATTAPAAASPAPKQASPQQTDRSSKPAAGF